MTCERIRPLLSGYHDDALSPEERARVRAHLSTCATCSAVLTAYETMYATLQRTVAPVPPDLHHNVYARIAQIEARPNARPPFVPAFLALLRSAGATAGLLAVLAALLAALVRLGGVPGAQHAAAPAATPPAQGLSAAGMALQHLIRAMGSGKLRALPPAAQTAVAPLGHVLAAGARWKVDKMSVGAAGVTVDGHVVQVTRSGAPLSMVPVRVDAAAPRGTLHSTARSAVVKSITVGTPSPIPTIPAGDGLVYVHLGGVPTAAANAGASRGELEWHAFAPGGTPRALVTLGPSPAQTDSGLRLYGASHVLGQPNSGPTPHVQTPLGPSVDDYAIAPDMQRIAWVQQDGRHAGRLEVAKLGATPITRTIRLGSHPVWAPDSRSFLFLQGTALALWSARDESIRRLVTPNPAGHQFISAFAWAPGGRFFTYVVSSPDPHGTSTVWLGDAKTGYTWKSFARRWIGAVAWMHGRALQTTVVPPAATPTPYDDTATPADVLRSFYNAINRRDFRRAYSYLSFTDGRSLRQFMTGYADTRFDQIVHLLPAPYLTASNSYALTCVGIQLLAHNKNGQTVRYGGWYLVKNTTGQNQHSAGWRIQMPGTHVKSGGTAMVPPQARCVPPPPTPTPSAG